MNKQLNLFSDDRFDSEQNSCSIAEIDSELKTAKFRAIQRFLDNGEKEAIACVNRYKAGNRNNFYYYRLSYRQRRKMKHIHIPGGNTHSDLANYRAKKLQELIDRGAELGEIIAMVQMFRSGEK